MTASDIDIVRLWTSQLPTHLLQQLTSALNEGADAVKTLHSGSHGAASKAVIESAYVAAKVGSGPYLAGLLTGYRAAQAEQATVVPVWTGPNPTGSTGSRLTLAVVAGLIDEALSELLLVSYATAPSPEVRDALLRAVQRGVTVSALLERTADNPKFAGTPDPLSGIAHQALYWPADARELGASMHAKILIIDRASALVGSANLTGYGVERNLECGVLIRGGHLPGAICDHIRASFGAKTSGGPFV